MPWPCYWMNPAGQVALGLRRYTPLAAQRGEHAWTCDAGWHQGFAWRGLTAPVRLSAPDQHGRRHVAAAAPVSRGDPAWPQECGRGCGYAFTPADTWQAWEEPVYAGPAGGLLVLHTGWPPPPGMAAAGPGAMWDGWWLPQTWKGPDGTGLIVRCPGGSGSPNDWPVDAPSTASGGRWARTGDPRRPATLTVTPSISIGAPGEPGHYHGFLTGGTLTDHLGG